ncbi:MAG: hypothetical protein N2C14_27815 [Planctomycetales bacterium]
MAHNDQPDFNYFRESNTQVIAVDLKRLTTREALRYLVPQATLPWVMVAVMLMVNRDYASNFINHPLLLALLIGWTGVGFVISLMLFNRVSDASSKFLKMLAGLISSFFTTISVIIVVLGPAVVKVLTVLRSQSG